jgi:hypothetical protein
MERDQSANRRRREVRDNADGMDSSDGEDITPKDSRPKKPQPAIPGICCVCGVTETPQWRSGPGGLNTLCNGCGIRWRKGRLVIDGETNPAAKRTTAAKKKSDGKFKDKSPKFSAQRARLSHRVLLTGEDTNDSSDEEANSEVEAMRSCRSAASKRRRQHYDDDIVYDSDEEQCMKRMCEEPITPGPAVEVGTRVVISSNDQNHKKLGTVVGFKRNGWYQIGLDENPFNPVRYRLSSLQVTQGGNFSGFIEDLPQSSLNQCTPMADSIEDFNDEPVTPMSPTATPGGTSTSVYSRGTRVQISHSHKKGTITGYKGGGWYFVHVDEDREVSMLRRGGFHILDHIGNEQAELPQQLRHPKDRIEQCIMADSATIESLEEQELQLLRHEIKAMKKRATDLRASMLQDIASLDLEMNKIVSRKIRDTESERKLVLDAALGLLGPRKSRGLRTSWGVAWVKSQEMLIDEECQSDFSDSDWFDEEDEFAVTMGSTRCRSVGHCPEHGRIHTHSSGSEGEESDSESDNDVHQPCSLSADEGVEEVSADEPDSDEQIDESDAESEEDINPDGIEGEICGSINTRRNRPCQRVGFCPYHGGRADSKLPARPDGVVHSLALEVSTPTVAGADSEVRPSSIQSLPAETTETDETMVPSSPVQDSASTPTRRRSPKSLVDSIDALDTPVTKKMDAQDMLNETAGDEHESCEGDDAVLDTPLDKNNDLHSDKGDESDDKELGTLMNIVMNHPGINPAEITKIPSNLASIIGAS